MTLVGKTKDRTGKSLESLSTPLPSYFTDGKNPGTILGQVKYFVEVLVFSPIGFEARDSHFSHWDIWTVTCYPQESKDRAKGSLILSSYPPLPHPQSIADTVVHLSCGGYLVRVFYGLGSSLSIGMFLVEIRRNPSCQ